MTRPRGFTLIEMAIVLVIVTILIGGLAMPLSAQIQARRIAETKQTMEEARDALMGYAMMTNMNIATAGKPFLPCPDTTGDGIEDRNGAGTNCSSSSSGVSYGWFPWVTLGAAPQDAWGNRLRYVVISQFANSTTGFSGSSTTTLTICTNRNCTGPLSSEAQNVAFALVSHGPNGWGALNVNNSTIPPTTLAAPSGPDEVENFAINSLPLVMRAPTKADSALGEFDDLVAWTSLTPLIFRVCSTGSGCVP